MDCRAPGSSHRGGEIFCFDKRTALNEKADIIYVNGEVKDDTPLGRLMQDLSCYNSDEMNYKELADKPCE